MTEPVRAQGAAGRADVSVIVPTLNRDTYLRGTLASIQQQSDVTFEIIVADQNVITAEQRCPDLVETPGLAQVLWVHCPGQGVVRARNLAVSLASGEIVVFVDDDVRIDDARFLAKHIAAYKTDTGSAVSAVCGRETNPGGDIETVELSYARTDPLADVFWFPRNYARRIDVAVLSTANCSVRREVLLEIGCFDERFAGASYGDDSDLALRLHDAGHRVVYDPEPTLVHLMAGTGGLRLSDRRRSSFSESDRVLSSIVFYLKHVHSRYPQHRWYFLYHFILRKSLLLRSNVTHPWRLPAVLWGMIDAYRQAHRASRAGYQGSAQSR